MPSRSGLILFKEQEYTEEGLLQRFQHCKTANERYDAQIEIRDYLLAYNARWEQTIERFYHYVVDDRAWIGQVDRTRFEQEWREAQDMAKRSKRQKDRLSQTRKKVMKERGEAAEELVEGEVYKTVSKVRSVSIRHSLAEARSLLNPAILARIRRTDDRNRKWSARPQAKDYDDVIRKFVHPAIRPEDLLEFGLYIDNEGALRQLSDASRGFIEETLPSPPISRTLLLPGPSTRVSSPLPSETDLLHSSPLPPSSPPVLPSPCRSPSKDSATRTRVWK